MAATFLSYRREDSAGYAGRLRESLERRLGGDAVFRDVDTIEPGQDFVNAITERLEECRVLVALIGREWIDVRDSQGKRRLDQVHDYVRLEIAAALERPGVLVVPVLVEGAPLPPPEQLPDSIRPLARRQAISLRDETWDADVERLAHVIRSASPHRSGGGPAQRNQRMLYAAAAVLAIIALGIGIFRRETGPARSGPPQRPEQSQQPERPARSERPGDAYSVDIPRVVEVAHGSVIYTVRSVNVRPRVNHNIVRVRVQVMNHGTHDTNFWDSSFRLVAGARIIAASGGLNEVVPGRSIRWGIVSFEVPPEVTKATLQMTFTNQATAEVPLDLSPTGEPPADEQGEVEDSQAHAIRLSVVSDPRPLIAAGEVSVTLTRITTRRFANALRLSVATRMTNNGAYPVSASGLVLRALAGDDSLGPVESSNQALEAKTSASIDAFFDLPPSAHRVVLRATLGNETTDVPLELR